MVDLNKAMKAVKAKEIDKLPKWGNYDWSKKSLAVLAANEQGDGVVLWTVGAYLNFEIKEGGLYTLDDLGLQPPSVGIWIWEGIYRAFPSSASGSYFPDEVETEPEGSYRQPEPHEWVAIHEGKCPWNDEEWLESNP